MNPLSKILGGTLGDVIKSVGSVIDSLTTTDAEKLEAQRKLTELTLGFQEKMAELDQQWAETQAGVITAESKSESVLARSWRPILMLVFTYIIAHNYVIAPVFGVVSVPIPPEMWDLLRLGVGGYIAGRSIEKVAPHVAEAFTKK